MLRITCPGAGKARVEACIVYIHIISIGYLIGYSIMYSVHVFRDAIFPPFSGFPDF